MRLILAILILFAFIIGCGGEKKTDMEPKAQPELKSNITVEQLSAAVDPVCGMTVNQDNLVATATYEGKTYGFCSQGCKEAFEKDPVSFVAKLQEIKPDSSYKHESM